VRSVVKQLQRKKKIQHNCLALFILVILEHKIFQIEAITSQAKFKDAHTSYVGFKKCHDEDHYYLANLGKIAAIFSF
jgi:hypothetical protein